MLINLATDFVFQVAPSAEKAQGWMDVIVDPKYAGVLVGVVVGMAILFIGQAMNRLPVPENKMIKDLRSAAEAERDRVDARINAVRVEFEALLKEEREMRIELQVKLAEVLAVQAAVAQSKDEYNRKFDSMRSMRHAE